ncbi:DUF4157 domain-containing protein [Treponema socranskii]|uniref:eCIS core domain-containing protein n=1 Tax=Treponema socranskii TaxID=53419 RepID=UPI0028F174C4|nr:DUF4157 domain-containing protein [Treponema socranskii]
MGTKSYEVLAAEEKCKVFFEWFELLLELSIQDLKAVEAAPKMNNNDGFSEYGNRRPITEYVQTNDRTFPLDTVKIKGFEKKYNTILETPLIHYGAQSDVITRSMQALAIAIGKDIYIRSGHYKPETEEGRALLAHEMTHVAQYSEKRMLRQTDRKELEAEAEYAEKNEYYESDPVTSEVIGGVGFRIRKSKLSVVKQMIKERLEWLIEEYCVRYNDERALRLLVKYAELEAEGEMV